MKAFLQVLRSKVGLMVLCAFIAAIAGWSAAKWRIDQRAKRVLAQDAEYRKATEAAGGRAEFVAAAELVSAPAKYDGRRVILEGTWSSGFEHSSLRFEGIAQNFWIWVDVDWSKVDAPKGDFSARKKNEDAPKPDQNGHVSRRITAEGTFHYRHRDKGALFGYGHMGVAEGYFLIDRMFEFEWTEKEPNQ